MTSFEVLSKMADADLDIRLAPLKNILRVRVTKNGGEVTIGVDRQTALDLCSPSRRLCGGLVVADKGQFDAIERSGT